MINKKRRQMPAGFWSFLREVNCLLSVGIGFVSEPFIHRGIVSR